MEPLEPSHWPDIVKPGSRVFVGSGAACPHALVESFLAQAQHYKDVELVHILTLGSAPWVKKRYAAWLRTNSFFLGPHTRQVVGEDRVDYTPAPLSSIPQLFTEGILPIDVALIQVSPPDNGGNCSLGVSVDIIPAAWKTAAIVVAQINPHMPSTCGQTKIPTSAINYFFERAQRLPELPAPESDEVTRRIAEYTAQLIDDGSTLQLGIGHLPHAVISALKNHRHLGVHTELMSDAMMEAFESGVIDNSRKTFHPGKMVTSFCMGSQKLYEFVHANEMVEFYPSEYVNNPINIAKNDRMVAINSAIEVDLSGQVAADSLGGRFYSGIGGQTDFIRGAALSKQGRPVIALPSTAQGGKVSRIVQCLQPGTGVVTSRGDVQFVVTEYGIATLRGRSIRERALELIQVAHPKFREELLEQAKKAQVIPSFHTIPTQIVSDIGDLQSQLIEVAGEKFTLRPLHSSDIRRMQTFFYSHNQSTIRQRYGYQIDRMTRERAYQLVNVDQEKDLALALLRVFGPRQEIVGIGRYYLDDDGRGAEMAFVVKESERRKGLATILLKQILEIGQKRKLKRLWAMVHPENRSMLGLFHKFGAQTVSREPGEVEIEFKLPLSQSE